eukprot:134827-Chlamydomonas_euryale.AAC.1
MHSLVKAVVGAGVDSDCYDCLHRECDRKAREARRKEGEAGERGGGRCALPCMGLRLHTVRLQCGRDCTCASLGCSVGGAAFA